MSHSTIPAFCCTSSFLWDGKCQIYLSVLPILEFAEFNLLYFSRSGWLIRWYNINITINYATMPFSWDISNIVRSLTSVTFANSKNGSYDFVLNLYNCEMQFHPFIWSSVEMVISSLVRFSTLIFSSHADWKNPRRRWSLLWFLWLFRFLWNEIESNQIKLNRINTTVIWSCVPFLNVRLWLFLMTKEGFTILCL